jgi:hypothetical protein
MDPATLGVVSLVGSVVSGITGAVGAIQTAGAQADAARYQAAVNRNNQIIAQQNATRSAQAGAVQAQNRDLRTRQVVGQITAAQGASGIDIDSTSSKEVRDSASQLGRFDAQTVYDNAMLTSRAESAQATNFGEQAKLDTMRASNAESAGLLGGFGSILGGATSFADKWLKFQTTGVGGVSYGAT